MLLYLRVSFSQHSLQYPQKQTGRRIFCLLCLFAFILGFNLFNIIITITDSPIHSKRFSESVTDSKYVLKVLDIIWFSERNLSFSINVILEPPCKCFFESMVWEVRKTRRVIHSHFMFFVTALVYLYSRVRTCFVYLNDESVGYWYIVVICQNQLTIFIHTRSTTSADYSGINYLFQALVFLAKIEILSIASGSKISKLNIF